MSSRLCGAAALGAVLAAGCAREPACPAKPPLQRYQELKGGSGARPNAVAVAWFAITAAEGPNTLCWVRRGDNHAEFALAFLYENGLGNPVNLEAARILYKRAATPQSGQRSFYSAPVGNQRYGSSITLPVRGGQAGLPEAEAALRRLERSGPDPL